MSKEKAELRRYEDDLYICGKGALIMGVWSAVKSVMQLYLTPFLQSYDLVIDQWKDEMPYAKAALIIFLAISFTLVTLAHIYSGVNAMKAATGKKYSKGYRAVSVILMVLLLAGIPFYNDYFKIDELEYTAIASIVTDLTTVYLLAVLLRSARKIKKLGQKREDS